VPACDKKGGNPLAWVVGGPLFPKGRWLANDFPATHLAGNGAE
jgi:hypothetical protein